MVRNTIALLAALSLVACGSGDGTKVAEKIEPTPDKVATIKFVLSSGFLGVIKIGESPNGQGVAPKNGIYEIVVPESGLVSLKNTAFFNVWHHEQAGYQNGTVLPKGDVEETAQDSINFYGLWSDSNGYNYYFVGTKIEVDELQKSAGKADELLQAQAKRPSQN